eukprot:s1026_g2.t1
METLLKQSLDKTGSCMIKEEKRLKRLPNKKKPKPKKKGQVIALCRNGKKGVPKKVKSVLRDFGLRARHSMTFILNNEDLTIESARKLQEVKPFTFWGVPSFKNVYNLVHKKAVFVDKEAAVKKVVLSDNMLIEKHLGDLGVICTEDLAHVIHTGGKGFDEVMRRLAPVNMGDSKKVPHVSEQIGCRTKRHAAANNSLQCRVAQRCPAQLIRGKLPHLERLDGSEAQERAWRIICCQSIDCAMALRSLLLLLVARAAAVSVDELAKWFESAQGFDYFSDAARKLAEQAGWWSMCCRQPERIPRLVWSTQSSQHKELEGSSDELVQISEKPIPCAVPPSLQEAPILTQCDVSVQDLTKLKAAMYDTSALDLSMDFCKQNLLPLAKQHVDPDELTKMYGILYGMREVDLSRSQAQTRSIELVKAYAEADQVKALFQTLDSMSGINLPKSEAQAKSLELGKLGCDPVALTNSFKAAQGSKDQRLKDASDSAMRANLNGEARRYAKDGQIYSVKDELQSCGKWKDVDSYQSKPSFLFDRMGLSHEFQDYYKDTYRQEWANGVPEMKMARDGKAYTVSQYRIYYAGNWENEWHAASPATQQRLAEDGKPYTVAEFVQYYKDDWQTKWRAAPELPCKECRTQVWRHVGRRHRQDCYELSVHMQIKDDEGQHATMPRPLGKRCPVLQALTLKIDLLAGGKRKLPYFGVHLLWRFKEEENGYLGQIDEEMADDLWSIRFDLIKEWQDSNWRLREPALMQHVQLTGRKRFILFPPEAQSMVDLDAPDDVRFPQWSGASGYMVELEAGEALYIPPVSQRHNVILAMWFFEHFPLSAGVSVGLSGDTGSGYHDRVKPKASAVEMCIFCSERDAWATPRLRVHSTKDSEFPRISAQLLDARRPGTLEAKDVRIGETLQQIHEAKSKVQGFLHKGLGNTAEKWAQCTMCIRAHFSAV